MKNKKNISAHLLSIYVMLYNKQKHRIIYLFNVIFIFMFALKWLCYVVANEQQYFKWSQVPYYMIPFILWLHIENWTKNVNIKKRKNGNSKNSKRKRKIKIICIVDPFELNNIYTYTYTRSQSIQHVLKMINRTEEFSINYFRLFH